MDWVDTTEEGSEPAHALRQPFDILRPVPTQATARVQKVQTGKGKQQAKKLGKRHLRAVRCKLCWSANYLLLRSCCCADKVLQAFPVCFPQETEEQQAQRQQAYSSCWSALSQHLEVLQTDADHKPSCCSAQQGR